MPQDTPPAGDPVGAALNGAVLRHAPFALGELRFADGWLHTEGWLAMPEDDPRQPVVLVNGHPAQKAAPVTSRPDLAAHFPHVRARWLGVSLSTPTPDEPWITFEASPDGRPDPARWRQVLHHRNPAYESFPMPPAPNLRRTIGKPSVSAYVGGGSLIARNVEAWLAENNTGFHRHRRVLDWGCGAGRASRYLMALGAEVTGVDIDADNVAWCAANLPGARFRTVPLRPPMPFAEASFDLVVGVSVMTHLSEADQFLWLEELRRVTRPGGLLFLSVQGPVLFSHYRHPVALWRRIEAEGFVDRGRDGALDAVLADRDYYRETLHSRAYLRSRWAEFFDVLAVEDAIAALQDFVVLRRRR